MQLVGWMFVFFHWNIMYYIFRREFILFRWIFLFFVWKLICEIVNLLILILIFWKINERLHCRNLKVRFVSKTALNTLIPLPFGAACGAKSSLISAMEPSMLRLGSKFLSTLLRISNLILIYQFLSIIKDIFLTFLFYYAVYISTME